MRAGSTTDVRTPLNSDNGIKANFRKKCLGIQGFEMIIKVNYDFFIQWDNLFLLENNLCLGIFNFWINDQCYPAKGINITLNALFNDLVSNISEIKNLKNDLGNTPIEEIDFLSCDDKRLVWCNTGELYQHGFKLAIGFNKDVERVLYSLDYEKSYNEIALPKGTLLETFEALEQIVLSDD